MRTYNTAYLLTRLNKPLAISIPFTDNKYCPFCKCKLINDSGICHKCGMLYRSK